MQKITLKIQELDCAEEVNLLNKALKNKEGIHKLDFDIVGRKMVATYEPQKIDSETIISLVRSTGMSAIMDGEEDSSITFWKKNGRLLLTLWSGLFIVLGALLSQKLFYYGAILSGGFFIAPKAWQGLKRFSFDMNVLMVIAVLGAIAIDQTYEGAMVTFLFSVALLLESWSVEKARKAIGALLDLSPKLARVMEGENLIEKNVEDILIGERLLVRPGEKIPLDGEVAKGNSSVNQAPITGESMPIQKSEGDPLFAGTINEDGALEILVTKTANDTTIARIIQMVQDARTRRAKSEKWVDRFSRIYTPIMMLFALLVAVIPPLFFGESWDTWIYRGLVMLVIACPCALVISTPVSIVSGLTRAARTGVLIKGGIYLELVAKMKAIALDKTGTITMGQPKVQNIHPLNHHSEEDLLHIAASLEVPSEHPLSRAIVEKAKEKNLSVTPATNFQIFKGLGAEGDVGEIRYWIGSHRFMHESHRKENEEAHKLALTLEDAGHSVIAIGDFTHICGLMSIADQPRPNIAQTLSAIEDLGIEKIVMLTGDNEKTAQTLANEVGLDDYRAELMPEDKVKAIEELKNQHSLVAMVGDGVNDAPAMAASSFGIAMGGMGTDAAFETADIVLMNDEVSLLPWLIRHARKVLTVIKQNIFFALALKALFITLALFGLATLWMAIAADTGASLLVIFNGLRLLKKS